MKGSFSNRLAIQIGESLSALMPKHRRTWALAMKTEIEALAASEAALLFALGCLWTGLGQRFPLVVWVRVALAGMSGALTVCVGTFAIHALRSSLERGTSVPIVLLLALAVLGMAYALGAVFAAKGAFNDFIGIARAMLLMACASYVATLPAMHNHLFLHALSTEGVGIWAMFLGLGVVGRVSSGRPLAR